MRHTTIKILLVVVMAVSLLGLFISQAKADGGGSPFFPKDGRINPYTEDKLTVYLNDDHVHVWGIDPNLHGFPLTDFTYTELISDKVTVHQTAYGTVTLQMISPATWHVGWKDQSHTKQLTVVDKAALYSVSWVGAFGANGVGPFQKFFRATYILPPQ